MKSGLGEDAGELSLFGYMPQHATLIEARKWGQENEEGTCSELLVDPEVMDEQRVAFVEWQESKLNLTIISNLPVPIFLSMNSQAAACNPALS